MLGNIAIICITITSTMVFGLIFALICQWDMSRNITISDKALFHHERCQARAEGQPGPGEGVEYNASDYTAEEV